MVWVISSFYSNHGRKQRPQLWMLTMNVRPSLPTMLMSDGQGGLPCYSSLGRKESDTTEWLNWTDKLIFILLHMGIKLSQHICWKEYSFPTELPWHPCRKSTDYKLGLYFWTLSSIPLIYVYTYTCPSFSCNVLQSWLWPRLLK